jgi:hypothetical protein
MTGRAAAGAVGTASAGPLVAVTPRTFWSLDLQTNSSSGVWTDSSVRSFLNQTPFTWFRYGEGTEECNITANIMYAPNGSSMGTCQYNLTAFKLWCVSVTPRSHPVLPLPGENNNSAEDAFIADWIVHTLGFQPDYWSIGNEPQYWKHYGIPWQNWSVLDNSRATPVAYAIQLKAAISAVTALNPGPKFMGLDSARSCDHP